MFSLRKNPPSCNPESFMEKTQNADLATSKDAVEDDAKEVDGGGDEKDGLPLLLQHCQVPVAVLSDLLRRDRADHPYKEK
jgi:hypothetical protein